MHDVPVDFKDKSVVGLTPQDWEQGLKEKKKKNRLSTFQAPRGADRAVWLLRPHSLWFIMSPGGTGKLAY